MKQIFKLTIIALAISTLVACNGDDKLGVTTEAKAYTGFDSFYLEFPDSSDHTLAGIKVYEAGEDESNIYFVMPQDALDKGLVTKQELAPYITTKANESVYIGAKQIVLNPAGSHFTIDFTKADNNTLKIIPFGTSESQAKIFNLHFSTAESSNILFRITKLSKTPEGFNIIAFDRWHYNELFNSDGQFSEISNKDIGSLSTGLYVSVNHASSPMLKVVMPTPLHFMEKSAHAHVWWSIESYQAISPNGLVSYSQTIVLRSNTSSIKIANFAINDNNIESYVIHTYIPYQITIHTKAGVTEVSGATKIYTMGDDSKLTVDNKAYSYNESLAFTSTTDSILKVYPLDGTSATEYKVKVAPDSN